MMMKEEDEEQEKPQKFPYLYHCNDGAVQESIKCKYCFLSLSVLCVLIRVTANVRLYAKGVSPHL